MKSSTSPTKTDTDVRAVVRALSIFDAFNERDTSLSLQEISERIDMPKATTFRLVNTVSRAGFLVRLADQRYCLSGKVARLGSLVRSNLNIRDAALPVMSELNRLSGETITLNVASGVERVCLEVVDTPAPLMAIVRPGEHVSILFGATGRILLADMSDDELDHILQTAPSGATIDRAALVKELKRYRLQGYALTRGQRIPGITAIGVLLHGPQLKERYCLALTGPSVRVDPRETEFVDLVVAAGRQISEYLGASSAPPETEKVAKPPKSLATS